MNESAQSRGTAAARAGAPTSTTDLVRRLRDGLGWRRAVMLRRALAAALALVAVVVGVRGAEGPAPGAVPVVVAARELVPGSTVRVADVEVRGWPRDLVPAGALTEPAQLDGRVLAAAAGRGEVLTGLRLVGPELAMLATGRTDATSVPIRLADGDVAGLLSPGRAVDVVTLGARSDQPTVVAAAAVVLTVLPSDSKSPGHGRVVVVAVPRAVASRLAAATLGQDVAVTLR